MPMIAVEDADVAYDVIGDEAAPTLLFIHGWTSDRRTFCHQLSHFARTYRCIAVDLPGHGDSKPVPHADYSIAFYKDRLKKFAALLGLDHAVVIGHSLGGLLALELLADDESHHPCAALIDPAPIVKTPALLASLNRTRDMLKTLGRENAQAILANKVFFKKTDPSDLHEIVKETARRADDDAALKTWDGIIGHNSADTLTRIAKPLLFVNAERPQNREDDIRSLAPHVLWGRTIGTGHFNHMVVPRQVNAMIDDFLGLQKHR